MKKIAYYISVILTIVLLFARCEKELFTSSRDSNDKIKIELFYGNTYNLKEGEEDDDEPVPDTLPGRVSSGSQFLFNARVDLLNSINSNIIESTFTNINGYFCFYDVETGTYIIIVKVDGEIVETIYVTI